MFQKPVQNLSSRDVEWILDYRRKAKWTVRFMLYKKVWGKEEALNRNEHLNVFKKIQKDLTLLRKTICLG